MFFHWTNLSEHFSFCSLFWAHFLFEVRIHNYFTYFGSFAFNVIQKWNISISNVRLKYSDILAKFNSKWANNLSHEKRSEEYYFLRRNHQRFGFYIDKNDVDILCHYHHLRNNFQNSTKNNYIFSKLGDHLCFYLYRNRKDTFLRK